MGNFYTSYQKLLFEMGSGITTTQRNYLEDMKASYTFAKTQHDTVDNILEGVERQKDKLEHDVEKLKKQKEKLTTEIPSMTQKVATLRENQKAIKKENKALQSLYRSKSVGKGIFKKRYEDAMNLLSEIHEYAAVNRCKTKEAFEKSIRRKVTTFEG